MDKRMFGRETFVRWTQGRAAQNRIVSISATAPRQAAGVPQSSMICKPKAYGPIFKPRSSS